MKQIAESNKTGKPAKRKQNFLANEVCYGLAIGMQLGLNGKQLIDYVFEDLQDWSKKALPKESKNV